MKEITVLIPREPRRLYIAISQYPKAHDTPRTRFTVRNNE